MENYSSAPPHVCVRVRRPARLAAPPSGCPGKFLLDLREMMFPGKREASTARGPGARRGARRARRDVGGQWSGDWDATRRPRRRRPTRGGVAAATSANPRTPARLEAADAANETRACIPACCANRVARRARRRRRTRSPRRPSFPNLRASRAATPAGTPPPKTRAGVTGPTPSPTMAARRTRGMNQNATTAR